MGMGDRLEGERQLNTAIRSLDTQDGFKEYRDELVQGGDSLRSPSTLERPRLSRPHPLLKSGFHENLLDLLLIVPAQRG